MDTRKREHDSKDHLSGCVMSVCLESAQQTTAPRNCFDWVALKPCTVRPRRTAGVAALHRSCIHFECKCKVSEHAPSDRPPILRNIPKFVLVFAVLLSELLFQRHICNLISVITSTPHPGRVLFARQRQQQARA